MRRFSICENFAVRVADHFIGKTNRAIFRLRDARPDTQNFIVLRRVMVTAVRVGHHDVAIVFHFHALVFDPQRANQLGAPHLEPDQIVRVIHHAHLVRLGITHSYDRIMKFNHSHVGYFSRSLCHTGLRFSRNDARPSLKSGVQRMRAFSKIARSKSWSTPASAEDTSSRLARARLLGLAAIRVSASSCARSSRRSAGTTSDTRPNSLASAASMMRPVSNRSRARFSPICRVRNTETIAGRKPIFTSVYPNFASVTASVKSQSVAMPQPPAYAAPFTAAMSGRGKLQMRRNIFAIRRESSWFSAGDCFAMHASISKSMPAQNALPAPVKIPTRA